MKNLSHINARGEAHMVDVADKEESRREAVASGYIQMLPATLALLVDGELPKGDVLATARIAGIQAAKRTHELIPLCHALPLSNVEVDFQIDETHSRVRVSATCRLKGRTGVEMEALTAVSVTCLTLYDMCKAVDKGMIIGSIQLDTKTGGKSGDYRRVADDEQIVTASCGDGEIGMPSRRSGLRVKCLAELRERLGVHELDIEFDELEVANIAGLKKALRNRDSRFSHLSEQRILCAVNQVMGSDETPLSDGDEVAFFPPVTGG
ncbi:cyclic pyranopterin monophosphate synthase MoaC [Aidingimonas halophila]|uniref:Cyclic pyranopterin monophosphate synthase n=1 Tax=Aidingimonas halophila TaxID=574349 RepID=A0A1H3B366_9GAMM|nr:cyclic pyranopterin monophosphate synthase MoaC [Aidingimonas halophila]GHC25825.1 hypothetical protein GCM10008094_16240 [Aidingimonas halophila]SDX36377.1 cyclic pyranopterin phosphate synthase [Aidingimonas halophila]